jgi:hypothetical protein
MIAVVAGRSLLAYQLGTNCDHLGEMPQITVGTFATRDEAEIVQGLLATEGIDSSIQADDAGGAYPFVLSGGAQVLVDQSDAAAASELLANKTDEIAPRKNGIEGPD